MSNVVSGFPWPQNLMKAILTHEEFVRWIGNIPDDAAALTEYMIATTFQEFESDILLKRYRDGQSLQIIGDVYSVSKEWIRIVVHKCIKRLQKHQRRETLINGLEWKISKEIKRAYHEGFKKGYRDSMGVSLDTVHNTYTMEDFLSGLPGYKCDLSELGLCERTFNRLIRGGICSVEELIQRSRKELFMQYKLTRGSIEEISVRLAEKGLMLRTDSSGADARTGNGCVDSDSAWTRKIVDRILNEDELMKFHKKIPTDFCATALYMLRTVLSEDESRILIWSIRDNASVEDMARQTELLRQQVAGLLNSALYKLQTEPAKSTLLLGIKGKIIGQLRMESERGYYAGFDTGVERGTKLEVGAVGEVERKAVTVTVESLPIEDLCLSVRGRNCLLREGIFTIGDLMKYSDADLLSVRGLGRGTLNEIRDKQREHYSRVRTDVEISQLGGTVSVDDPA